MIDFQAARNRMIREQLLARGIQDPRVLGAMQYVERHLFVLNNQKDRAYDDTPLAISANQTISQPYMVALMTELLQVQPDDRILEVGTGSGYQTAILAEMGRFVYSIERHKILADLAEDLLCNTLGYTNIEIKNGDGTIGWPEKAPFDTILVTAGAPAIPENLVNMLINYGRMVIPVGIHEHQELLLVLKRGDSYITKVICNCLFVPLIGKKGWFDG